MDTTESQPLSVFWCLQCNKPFHKQSTLKRHGYYCRSRKSGPSKRPRSCVSCARGKSACDNKQPECSRCIKKGIECHYPPNAARVKVPGQGAHSGRSKAATSSAEEHTAGIRSPPEGSGNGDSSVDGTLSLPDQELTDFGGEYLGWDDVGIGLADFLETQIFNAPISPESSTATFQATTSTAHAYQTQDRLDFSSLPISRTPTIAVRSLIHRPKAHFGTQRTASLIFHNLKSYPLMIQRHNDLPPFIHKGLISSGAEDADMESLMNCLSLVHLLNGGLQAGRKLFWKNVSMECERLSAEHLNLSKWGLLAAIQALTIYILVRLGDGETEHNNVDFLLMKAVSLLIQQLSRVDVTCQTQCLSCNKGLEPTWKEWIYRESRRRLGVVYRVVNMLVYFDPAAMCALPDDLVLAPLPARRQLWEAGDELAWEAEGRGGPHGAQAPFGLTAGGEVVRLEEGRLSCGDAWISRSSRAAPGASGAHTPPGWEEWCSGMDGFGGLVMLAASLL